MEKGLWVTKYAKQPATMHTVNDQVEVAEVSTARVASPLTLTRVNKCRCAPAQRGRPPLRSRARHFTWEWRVSSGLRVMLLLLMVSLRRRARWAQTIVTCGRSVDFVTEGSRSGHDLLFYGVHA